MLMCPHCGKYVNSIPTTISHFGELPAQQCPLCKRSWIEDSDFPDDQWKEVESEIFGGGR